MSLATDLLWPCSHEEYHADGRNSISRSELEVFIEDPLLYYGRHVTGEFERPQKDYFNLGEGAHCWFLQPELFARDIVEIPASALTSNNQRRGKAWDQFKAEHAGKCLLKSEDIALIKRMQASAMAVPIVRNLLTNADNQYEVTYRWEDTRFDMIRRARLDIVNPVVITDLKTTAKAITEAQIARDAENMGYHRQAAFYQDAAYEVFGEQLPVVFVFSQKVQPYGVQAVELPQDWINAGREEIERGLADLAECQLTGIWQRPTVNEILTIQRPAWAGYR